jgi:hypothetical protein
MEIKKYEKSEHFPRNEAVYVLHTIDNLSLEEISIRFQIAVEELKEIVHLHAKYEAAVMNAYS